LTLEAIVQGAGAPLWTDEKLYQNQSGLVGLNENVLDPYLSTCHQAARSHMHGREISSN
jgi:hypothetical protein